MCRSLPIVKIFPYALWSLLGGAALAGTAPLPRAPGALTTGAAATPTALLAPPPEGPPGALPYLVLPLLNRSGSTGLSWMTTALGVTAAEMLETHGGLRPAYGPAILAGLTPLGEDEELSLEQQSRLRDAGVELLIAGSYDRVDWRYGITLRALRLEGGRLKELGRATSRAAQRAAGSAGVLDLLEGCLRDLLGQLALPHAEALVLRRPTKDMYALTLYGRALQSLYTALAEPERRQAELEKAQKTLQRVCVIDPTFAEAHRALGLVYQELGDEGRALGQHSHALDLRPDYFAALLAQGRLYAQGQKTARALEAFERALRVRPWDLESRQALGELLFESGQLEEATRELQQVVAQRPEQAAARRTLATVYAARGMTEEGAAELLRLQTLQPDDLDVRFDLAAAYLRMGSLRLAAAVYDEILQRRPRHLQALRLRGDVARRLAEPDQAALHYQRLVKLAPDDPRGYFLAAAALMEAGQEGRAEQLWQDAQQFRRFLGEAWSNLGALELRRGDLARANWYLSRAVTRAPGRALAHYNYALLLDRLGQAERAAAELRIATELDPQDGPARGALATLQRRPGLAPPREPAPAKEPAKEGKEQAKEPGEAP